MAQTALFKAILKFRIFLPMYCKKKLFGGSNFQTLNSSCNYEENTFFKSRLIYQQNEFLRQNEHTVEKQS